MKITIKLLTVFLLSIWTLNAMSLDPGYHFQIDFSGESSDNITGWTTNVRPDHPKGGVQVLSGLYARFRNGVAAMKTNQAYSYAGTLSFDLKPDSYGTNNPGFKVYTSTDGADWETGWTEVFSTTYNDLNSEGNNFKVLINSGSTAVYIKLESINDDVDDSGTEYSFQLDNLELTDDTPVSPDNVEVSRITSSCLTVSSEQVIFTKGTDNIYSAHDSIGFDAECVLTCIPVSANASIEILKSANPYPGKSDTAIFKITSEDKSTTDTVMAIIARSLYQCKFGFLSEINNKTKEFDGWTFGGNRYPTNSRGNGGAYPGENAMRIYESGGYITSPKYSSISTLSFVAKFSKTDGELLKVQKSYDGIEFSDLRTYTPGSGPIPAYATESIDDSLSETQTIAIMDREVYIRFQYVNGNSDNPRTMVDDIACIPIYDPDEKFEVNFKVTDFNNEAVEGASFTFGNQELFTDSYGEVKFPDISFQMEALTYSVTKADFLPKSGSILVRSNIEKKITITKEELEIFLALGQSNMAGRAEIGENTDEINGAYLLNSEDVWIPAVNPMNLYSNIRKEADMQKLGPAYSFAKTISSYTDKPVCIIANARGGTSITAFSEGGEYYQAMMNRIKKANEFGTVKAVIWHQGESNSSNFGSYLGILNTLVMDIREAVDNDFFFLAGQLGGWGTKYELFNENLTNIKTSVENADYVINDRLWHIGDETHFNTPSQILLGSRYAQKVLEKVYEVNIGIYEFSFSGKLFVSCENDTIHSGDRIIYTTFWKDDQVFKIHSASGEKFKSLSINGTTVGTAAGEISYEFNPFSRDSVYNIEATFESDLNSMEEKNSDELKFFPNPVSEKVFFSGGNGDYNVFVFDISGRLLLEGKGKTELDVTSLKSGYYILQLTSDKEKLSEQIVIF